MIHAVLICELRIALLLVNTALTSSAILQRSFNDRHGPSTDICPVNTQGASRLTKFYKQPANPALKTQIPEKIFKLISSRPGSLCNFLDAPGLSLSLGDDTSASNGNGYGDGRGSAAGGIKGDAWNADDTRIVYRLYATLYFVFVVDGSESELGVLDLIQVCQLVWR